MMGKKKLILKNTAEEEEEEWMDGWRGMMNSMIRLI